MNSNLIKKKTAPYIKEVLYRFIGDTFIVILAVILIFSSIKDFRDRIAASIWIFIIILIYCLIEFILIYRFGILVEIDRIKGDYITKEVYLNNVQFHAKELGKYTEIIRIMKFKFYKKELELIPLVMSCIDEHGEKEKLIMTVFEKQRYDIYELFQKNYKLNKVKATYCKRSKIILRLEQVDKTERKISSKEQAKIIKKLNRININ